MLVVQSFIFCYLFSNYTVKMNVRLFFKDNYLTFKYHVEHLALYFDQRFFFTFQLLVRPCMTVLKLSFLFSPK